MLVQSTGSHCSLSSRLQLGCLAKGQGLACLFVGLDIDHDVQTAKRIPAAKGVQSHWTKSNERS